MTETVNVNARDMWKYVLSWASDSYCNYSPIDSTKFIRLHNCQSKIDPAGLVSRVEYSIEEVEFCL